MDFSGKNFFGKKLSNVNVQLLVKKLAKTDDSKSKYSQNRVFSLKKRVKLIFAENGFFGKKLSKVMGQLLVKF